MIRLRPDCLVFESSSGEAQPVSAEQIALELIGKSAPFLDETILRNVAQSILHYFKHDLGQESVSPQEFARALERTLNGLGFDVKTQPVPLAAPRGVEADLGGLANESGGGMELAFFPRLRAEVRRQLEQGSQVTRFHGLRGCVKTLTGAKRWSQRCQSLSDQIVEYLRTCLQSERAGLSCGMVVQ